MRRKAPNLPARTGFALAFGAVILACAAATSPHLDSTTGAAGHAAVLRQDTLVPPGYGTLKQDQVTVTLRSGPLLLKVTPLAEGVIRLLAPDTYNRLHGLAESRRADATSRLMRPAELFLVSFYSYQPDVAFQPEDLQLLHQGQLARPVAIFPITTGWGSQRLQQQDNQSALYAFESPIDYEQPLTVRYGPEQAEGWRTVIPLLRAERNRVLSQVGGSH